MHPIYLDHMSTTPLDKRVRAKMLSYLAGPESATFGNGGSLHYYGYIANAAIQKARCQIAGLVKCSPGSIIWTSGATEANNLALKGVAEFYRRQGRHIITSTIEHKSILASCSYLASHGFKISYVNPAPTGLVDPEQIRRAIRKDTILISLIHANNEIGTIQDIATIGNLAREHGILFHVDAAQSMGKIPIVLQNLAVDLMSFSAHKIYGPKGIGALYIREQPKLALVPLLHGGTQEYGYRAGTLPTHQIVGMGVACQLASEEMENDRVLQQTLLHRLWQGIQHLADIHLHSSFQHTLPHILNFGFSDISGEQLASALANYIAISSRATCLNLPSHHSHVLQAIGVPPSLNGHSIRLAIGRFTTAPEIEQTIQHLVTTVNKLRESR